MDLSKLEEIYGRLHTWIDKDDGTFFHKEKTKLAKPYDRTEYILRQCKRRKVLHFGFTDSPFTEERINNGEILHLKIKKVSKESLSW